MNFNLSAKIPVGNYPLRLPALITTTPRERINNLLGLVADLYGLTIADLKGPRRTRWIVSARHHAMWVLHNQRLSSTCIGRILNRDHSTVLNGIKRHIQKSVEQQVDSIGGPEPLS